MTQFNSANFKTINIQKRGEAEMQLNKRYITFTKSLIEEMGWPAYVRLLVNAKSGEFAIQACKSTDENAYKFSRPKGAQTDAKFCCTASVKRSIIALMDDEWDENKFYGFKGTYFQNANAMVFDLKNYYLRNIESFQRI